MQEFIICEEEENISILLKRDSDVLKVNQFLSSILTIALQNNKNVHVKAHDIMVENVIEWNSFANLTFTSQENIIFQNNARIINKGNGFLYLKSGMNNHAGTGNVVFQNEHEPQIYVEGKGKVHVYYNPNQGSQEHKYHHPYPYFKHISPQNAVTAYMLVNDLEDLQDINMFLHGNYALSSNIDASETKNWNQGKGFEPLTRKERNMPFSGNFDGNHYEISNLFINRPDEDDVGLFGQIAGQKYWPCVIKDLSLRGVTVKGGHYVGGLAGDGQFCNLSNIQLSNFNIDGKAIVGGVFGTMDSIGLNHLIIEDNQHNFVHAEEYHGYLIGSAQNSYINYDPNLCHGECISYALTTEVGV